MLENARSRDFDPHITVYFLAPTFDTDQRRSMLSSGYIDLVDFTEGYSPKGGMLSTGYIDLVNCKGEGCICQGCSLKGGMLSPGYIVLPTPAKDAV